MRAANGADAIELDAELLGETVAAASVAFGSEPELAGAMENRSSDDMPEPSILSAGLGSRVRGEPIGDWRLAIVEC
jgi:hypothetical protein